MILKDRLTDRTLVVLPHEHKKMEILMAAGWTIVPETPVAKPVEPATVAIDPVTPTQEPEPTTNQVDAVIDQGVTDAVYEIVGDDVELPLPATEPRKATLHAPKSKKTLKLPSDYA